MTPVTNPVSASPPLSYDPKIKGRRYVQFLVPEISEAFLSNRIWLTYCDSGVWLVELSARRRILDILFTLIFLSSASSFAPQLHSHTHV